MLNKWVLRWRLKHWCESMDRRVSGSEFHIAGPDTGRHRDLQDRRTDGRHAISIPRSLCTKVHRAVNSKINWSNDRVCSVDRAMNGGSHTHCNECHANVRWQRWQAIDSNRRSHRIKSLDCDIIIHEYRIPASRYGHAWSFTLRVDVRLSCNYQSINVILSGQLWG